MNSRQALIDLLDVLEDQLTEDTKENQDIIDAIDAATKALEVDAKTESRQVMLDHGIVEAFWSKQDVIDRWKERFGERENFKELSDQDAEKIKDELGRSHDCSTGINWEVIDCVTDIVFPNHF